MVTEGASQVIPLQTTERAELRARRRNSRVPDLWDALDAVRDPELPVLSIWDLGVLQNVELIDGRVCVEIIPTWSGCPAMELIEELITERLGAVGFNDVVVRRLAAPAWTTDWMEARARTALRDFGVAPPGDRSCPQCGSQDTQVISEYGSTACKAMYRCLACREPFDAFKAF